MPSPKEETELRHQCPTKSHWIKLIESKKEKLSKTPKEHYSSPPPCSHNQGEYGNCSCTGSYYTNYEYTSLENEIKFLFSLANQFCDQCSEVPLLPSNAAFCYRCGNAKVYSPPAHSNCKNFSLKFKYCPDCAQPTTPLTLS